MANRKVDISGIYPKVENAEAAQYVADNDIPHNEHMTHEDWNTMATAVKELQDADDASIKGVRFNSTVYRPDSEGIVTFNQAGESDTYGIMLKADIDTGKTYIVKKGGELNVRIRYSAVRRTTLGDTQNYNDVLGTMVITRKLSTAISAETVYTRKDIRSIETTSSDYNIDLNLAEYALTGVQNITITFSTTYEDNNGYTRTTTGSITFELNLIDLYVQNRYNWVQPINATSGYFPLSLNISGKVQKYLFYEISGRSQGITDNDKYINFIPYTADVEGDLPLIQLTDAQNKGILRQGIHKIRCWVTCDDGSGALDPIYQVPNSITSEIITFRVLVLNVAATPAERSKLYLILQDVKSEIDNFAQVNITEFALWKSSPEDLFTADNSSTYDIRAMITNTGTGDLYTDVYNNMLYTDVSVQQKVSIDCTVEIESDDDTVTQFDTALRISNIDDGISTNLIANSEFDIANFAYIRVKNSQEYVPTAGASFQLNPKTRNNNEADWNTIKNTKDRTDNPVVASRWENFNHSTDGYVKDDDGVGILRILSGEKITITGDACNAFKNFATYGNSELTVEIDCKIRNITNNTDPIIHLSEVNEAGETMGIVMNPLEGLFVCAGNEQSRETHNFRWCENKRTHFVFTIKPDVQTKDNDIERYQLASSGYTYGPLALARVYINGVCNRAFSYTIAPNIWQTVSNFVEEGATRGKIGLVLGQDVPSDSGRLPGADLDIYSIRIYNTALTSREIMRNYLSSKATTEEKNYILSENAITNADGRISKELVENHLHRNTLTLHSAQEIWKGIESQKQNCYVEMHIFDQSTGEEDLERGGTIGKQAYLASLNNARGWDGKAPTCYRVKSQGNTANTYYWHNWSGKANDISFKIEIPFSLLHADFNWKKKESRYTSPAIPGSTIGNAKYPLFLNGTQISGDDVEGLDDVQRAALTIVVDDGWWDWNGMYHGKFWKATANAPKAKKLCNKINYASSMGHHKMGATKLFSDVMHKVLESDNCLPLSHVGEDNSHKNARFAVLEEPFFYFHQIGEDDPAYYHGPATFGAAKADKPTCGYEEEDYPLMCMFEGADNNVPLADFRIPFDDEVFAYYNETKTDWSYAYNNSISGVQQELQFDYDMGLTRADVGDDGLIGNVMKEAPTTAINEAFKTFCNFWYCHNTRLQLFMGTLNDLKNAYATADTARQTELRNNHQLCTSTLNVYRFNFTTGDFVDAGTWNRDTMTYSPGVRNIASDPMTASAYQTYNSEGTGDYGRLLILVRQAIVNEILADAGKLMCISSMLTHYNLVNFAMAGTDNCSKNTYLVFAPYAIKKDGSGNTIYRADNPEIPEYEYRWYFFADDMDTVLPTDNNGQTTKEWFIDRINDTYDYVNGYKLHTDYEGKNSVLFNAIEDAYDDALTSIPGVRGNCDINGNPIDPSNPELTPQLQSNMRVVLSTMQGLVEPTDTIMGFTASQTIMACWHKYFLQWTNYWPIVAFNEAGRIRYEYPRAMRYAASGTGSRGVDPIVQHMGDQRECEIDWCSRRSTLLAMYAAWGDFGGSLGGVGVEETGAISIDHQGVLDANGNSIDTFMEFDLKADRIVYPTASMGSSINNPHVRVMPGQTYHFLAGTVTGDRGGSLLGMNYYTEIGNIGNMLVSPHKEQKITGARLKKLIIVPTDTNPTEGVEYRTCFSPQSLNIDAPNLEIVQLQSKGLKGTINLTKCVRLSECNMVGSKISEANLAECTTLKTVRYSDNVTKIVLKGLINLVNISVGMWNKVIEIVVKNCSQETYNYVLTNVPSLLR